jgi:hypothetical protein
MGQASTRSTMLAAVGLLIDKSKLCLLTAAGGWFVLFPARPPWARGLNWPDLAINMKLTAACTPGGRGDL